MKKTFLLGLILIFTASLGLFASAGYYYYHLSTGYNYPVYYSVPLTYNYYGSPSYYRYDPFSDPLYNPNVYTYPYVTGSVPSYPYYYDYGVSYGRSYAYSYVKPYSVYVYPSTYYPVYVDQPSYFEAGVYYS